MKIAISAAGMDLDAPASPIFGRCAAYVLLDTETMACEGLSNPAMNAAGGAGIQAAQFLVQQGAQAVISGNLGPNAFDVLNAAAVPVYLFGGGTVGQAVQAFKAGELTAVGSPNVAAHSGMGMGRSRGGGRGG